MKNCISMSVLCLLFSLALVPATALAQAPGEPPVTLEETGLTRIVPDTIVHGFDIPALGNWEPFTSVIGTGVFVIEGNTYAEGSTSEQRYALTFQKVDGGDPVEGEVFFSDDGQPYRDVINFSRQNGNPGRVAGDKRPGAVNFIAGGESSLHSLDEFNSDNRWDDGVDRSPTARFGGVQVHRIDPDTLVQTPVSLAIDPVLGLGNTSGFVADDQMARFGGDVRALDNGNFIVIIDDRSELLNTGTSCSAAIIQPDGTIVKPGFLVSGGQIWSNLAVYRGGFAIRINAEIIFFDNDGNERGRAPQLTDVVSDTGRGDGTRIESHINSDFVFLSGFDSLDSIRIAVYDARSMEFVTETNVNELTPDLGGVDDFDLLVSGGRVEAGVDALNRICVAWTLEAGFLGTEQVVARVLAFHPDDLSFDFLTPTFLAFQNSGVDSGFRTRRPNVTMTTKQIIFAGNGEINSNNDITAGPDVANEQNFYTVISHPDPQEDPTTPVDTALREWSVY